jgi:hypothetical protein
MRQKPSKIGTILLYLWAFLVSIALTVNWADVILPDVRSYDGWELPPPNIAVDKTAMPEHYLGRTGW